MDFATAYYVAAQQLPTLTPNKAKLVKAIEDLGANVASAAALALTETHVRAALGFDLTEPVDWTDGCQMQSKRLNAQLAFAPTATAINWQQILDLIETYLPQILAILLPLLAKP